MTETVHAQGVHKYHKGLKYDVSSPRGLVRLAVYHVSKEKADFLGEALGSLEAYAEAGKSECQQPLGPRETPRSTAIMSSLAARDDDKVARDFVHKRAGEVVGRTVSKVHAVNGHHFMATHYMLPPNCQLCKKPIFGMGKAVYACDNCRATYHKECHFRALKCQ